ncbi:MAG: CocE/NonD family hydrolase [Candidatus Omnitrophica bacterium]|nr:CocE/NonD family hydrolase [Candidatus Omnitrophota bacterium]
MNRLLFVFLFSLCLAFSQAPVSAGDPADLLNGATQVNNVMVEMRDGVRLGTDILLPEGEGPFPVILFRNPYVKDGVTKSNGQGMLKEGYAIVSQDVRGRFTSEGVWDPFRNEGRDGHDTLEWIGKQPWCNGKIGLAGGSYLGFTQCINGPSPSKYLAAMNPIVPWGNTYHDIIYWGGALRFQLTHFWGGAQYLFGEGKPMPDIVEKGLFWHLPLITWDQQLGAEVFYLREWVRHPNYGEYWKPAEVGDSIENVTIPALYIGGWYDIFQTPVIDYWNGVRTRSKSEEARKRQYLIMGPWTHGVSPADGKVGDLVFGEHSNVHPDRLKKAFFAETMKGEDHGFSDRAPLQLFVMGSNVWRDESEWPLARTQFKPLYLSASGPANSASGEGRLSWDITEDGRATDVFTYNPEDPASTQGGALLWPTAGPRDQSEVEARKDVLVYSTDVLTETVEVTGPVKLILHAASSATDTDFTGKLVDVYPKDGKEVPYNLTDGIIRARYRNSDTTPSLIEPGRVYEYVINLGVTSNAFLPGHRIRVEISSSNFPRFDRNPNTGHEFGMDAQIQTAEQTIHHSEEHPSHLLLPIIPN